ncbi:MAG: hypothetical protein CR994_07715 [Maribacter sp.]|nr:MAG: hypothetical protein CR994_07715 [Maribacter sp.]
MYPCLSTRTETPCPPVFVGPQNRQRLPLRELLESYEGQSENEVPSHFYDFIDASRSIILGASKDRIPYYSFVGPYAGRLLEEKERSKDFLCTSPSSKFTPKKKEMGRKIIQLCKNSPNPNPKSQGGLQQRTNQQNPGMGNWART